MDSNNYAVKRVGLVKVPYANIVLNENVSSILTFCNHIYREANYRGHSLSYIQRSTLQRPPSKPIKLNIIFGKIEIRLLIYHNFVEIEETSKHPIHQVLIL